MSGQTIFVALRDALVNLYPQEADARVVVADARLNVSHIAFSPRAETNWHHILSEAIAEQRLGDLLQVVLKCYDSNQELLDAHKLYCEFVAQGGCLEPSADLPAEGSVFRLFKAGIRYAWVLGALALVLGGIWVISGDRQQKSWASYFLIPLGLLLITPPLKATITARKPPTDPSHPGVRRLSQLVYAKPRRQRFVALALLLSLYPAAIWIIARTSYDQYGPPDWAAGPGETLVVVARFQWYGQAAPSDDVDFALQISEQWARSSPSWRTFYDPALVVTNESEARRVGQKARAALVIWGKHDAYGVFPTFTILKQAEQFLEVQPPAYRGPDLRAAGAIGQGQTLADFVVRVLPEDAIFLTELAIGQMSYLSGDYEAATKHLGQALANKPTEALPGNDGPCKNLYSHTDREDQGVGKAELQCSMVLAHYFKAQAEHQYGNKLWEDGEKTKALGRFDEAEREYLQAIEHSTYFDAANNNLGILFMQREMIGKSSPDYLHPVPYFTRAGDCMKARRSTMTEDGAEIAPGLDIACYNRGNARLAYARQLIDQAQPCLAVTAYRDAIINDYTKALANNRNLRDPHKPLVYYNRGIAYAELARIQGSVGNHCKDDGITHALALAEHDFEQAIREARATAPVRTDGLTPVQALVQRASITLGLRNPDSDFVLAQFHLPLFRLGLAQVYQMGCRYDEARQEFTQLIDEQPGTLTPDQWALIYDDRGVDNVRLGQYAAALADLRKSLEISESATARYNLAAALALSGQTDEAVESLAGAIRADQTLAAAAACDADFDSVKSHPGFPPLATPERGCAAFGAITSGLCATNGAERSEYDGFLR